MIDPLTSCTCRQILIHYYIGIYFAVLLALALHRHVEPCQQDKEKFLWRWDIQFLSKRQRECSLTNQAPWTMSTRQGEVSLRVGYTFFCQRVNENARWHTRHLELCQRDKEKFLWGWDIIFLLYIHSVTSIPHNFWTVTPILKIQSSKLVRI